jgi:hypothetical protein
VIEAIFGFEEIFVGDIVMGNMAVIAVGHFPVGTVCPSDVLRGHDMAIDACLRVIGEVGGRIAQPNQVQPQPKNSRNQHGGIGPPFSRGHKAVLKKLSFELLTFPHRLDL